MSRLLQPVKVWWQQNKNKKVTVTKLEHLWNSDLVKGELNATRERAFSTDGVAWHCHRIDLPIMIKTMWSPASWGPAGFSHAWTKSRRCRYLVARAGYQSQATADQITFHSD
jgi:hypothetical protein